MNTTVNCPDCRTPSLSAHPLTQWWQRLAARWATHLEDSRKASEFDFASELSADTLRDIGAPEQWVSRASARRDTQQQRLLEMRQWRDG